jgi:hypothetical protein
VYLPGILVGLLFLAFSAYLLLGWLTSLVLGLKATTSLAGKLGMLIVLEALLYYGRAYWIELCCLLDGGGWSS